MPLKTTFVSDPGVYRTGLRGGLIDPWLNTVDRNRIYDEYIWWVNGMMTMESPSNPSDYEIVVFCVNHERSSGVGAGANSIAMRWSGVTGKFLGHDARASEVGIRDVTVGAKGVAHATWQWVTPADSRTYKFNKDDFDFDLVHPAGYYGGFSVLPAVPCVDYDQDLALMINNSPVHDYGEVAVFRESTGAFLYKFRVCGRPESIFLADDRRGYTVATDGTITVFNYVTKQVLSVLHASLSANPRCWAWDRIAKRILYFEQTPDSMPDGACTCRIVGFFPVPAPHGVTKPIPLSVPKVGQRVEWVSKVYGGAGEGIPGTLVSYSLESPAGHVINPQQHATDSAGNSRTFVTSSLAEENTLSASIEV